MALTFDEEPKATDTTGSMTGVMGYFAASKAPQAPKDLADAEGVAKIGAEIKAQKELLAKAKQSARAAQTTRVRDAAQKKLDAEASKKAAKFAKKQEKEKAAQDEAAAKEAAKEAKRQAEIAKKEKVDAALTLPNDAQRPDAYPALRLPLMP